MKTLKIKNINKEGRVEEKEIFEIKKVENSKHRILGQSTGININHCAQLGMKHCNNFWHRVRFFQIIKNEEKEKLLLEQQRKFDPNLKEYITIAFYEQLSDQTT